MWDVRLLEAGEVDAFRQAIPRAFGGDARNDDQTRRRFEAIFDLNRTLAAFDGRQLIGTATAFTLEVTVPGGRAVSTGGTTVVTVAPTHRRRGVLRSLMDAHFAEIAERGEPLAALWASEGSIYGRFGYGIATHNLEISFDASGVELGDETDANAGSVRLLDTEEAAAVLPGLYEGLRARQPGMLSRSDAWWEHRVLADPEDWRDGHSAKRHVLYEESGKPLGYATYRQKASWEDNLPNGKVDVVEVITTDEAAHTRLWAMLTNIDLFPQVEYWNLAVDDPLPLKLGNSRRVKRNLSDSLWVRVMDVPAALAARTYEQDGSVVFQVEDGSRPDSSGSYRLEVIDGVGHCEPVGSSAEVNFDADVLGHLYLGGGSALAMARAGRIGGDPEVIHTLHRMFRTDIAPWCPEVF